MSASSAGLWERWPRGESIPAAAQEAARAGRLCSSTVTCLPRQASSKAIAQPISPPPITTTSVASGGDDANALSQVVARQFDVMFCAATYPVRCIAIEGLANSRGCTSHQSAGRHNHAGGHHAQRRHQRFLTDFATVQKHRVHTDQGAAPDRAALEYRAMANGHFVLYDRGAERTHVQHAVV